MREIRVERFAARTFYLVGSYKTDKPTCGYDHRSVYVMHYTERVVLSIQLFSTGYSISNIALISSSVNLGI